MFIETLIKEIDKEQDGIVAKRSIIRMSEETLYRLEILPAIRLYEGKSEPLYYMFARYRPLAFSYEFAEFPPVYLQTFQKLVREYPETKVLGMVASEMRDRNKSFLFSLTPITCVDVPLGKVYIKPLIPVKSI